jgi:hypothetical protein
VEEVMGEVVGVDAVVVYHIGKGRAEQVGVKER